MRAERIKIFSSPSRQLLEPQVERRLITTGCGSERIRRPLGITPLWWLNILAQLKQLLDELQDDGLPSLMMSQGRNGTVSCRKTLVEKRRIARCLCRLGAEAFDDWTGTSRVLKPMVNERDCRLCLWCFAMPMAVLEAIH